MSYADIVDLGCTDIVRAEARDKIVRFEQSIRAMPDHLEGDCYPLRHIFTPGIYARQIVLPAGSILVGKIHREEHINFLESGHVKVFTEFGLLEELRGPLLIVSKPGTKRTVHAIEETVWTTIHHNPDNLTDLVELEKRIIAPDYETLKLEVKS